MLKIQSKIVDLQSLIINVIYCKVFFKVFFSKTNLVTTNFVHKTTNIWSFNFFFLTGSDLNVSSYDRYGCGVKIVLLLRDLLQLYFILLDVVGEVIVFSNGKRPQCSKSKAKGSSNSGL